MNVRIATLEDVAGIVDVHRSGIERWLKREGGRVEEAHYEELSVSERYLHGGPWMSIESCAVHLNNLLLEGQIAVVAEVDGRIVGEAELLISEEPVHGEITKIAHLDVIEVHREFRERGVGRAIVEFLEELALERGCRLFTATPDPSAVGFYKKIGVSEVVYRASIVEFDTSKFPEPPKDPETFEFSWDDVKALEMVAGRFQSSYHYWFVSFRDRIAGVDDVIPFESGMLGESYYVLRGLPSGDGGTLFLWGRREDLPLILGRAREIGFKKVRTVVDETVLGELKPRVLGENIILGRHLQ
ncbi:GNAT family N-acetyltransferase [Thermococcus sp. CX2]|nr:GNAT family N-acetyltransferase [Thermococcus sp. CX2]